MGENRRYERPAPVDAATEAEVRALRIIAGLLEGSTQLITDRAVARQLGELLRTAATELSTGRALPRPVRRAVRHLADAIRIALDPACGLGTSSGGPLMRASEQATFDRRLRGTYVGIAVASLLDNMALELETVPGQLRRDGLAIAHFQLDGPDGPNDPRTAGRTGLASGPGH